MGPIFKWTIRQLLHVNMFCYTAYSRMLPVTQLSLGYDSQTALLVDLAGGETKHNFFSNSEQKIKS